jgi:hypothetical protein
MPDERTVVPLSGRAAAGTSTPPDSCAREPASGWSSSSCGMAPLATTAAYTAVNEDELRAGINLL